MVVETHPVDQRAVAGQAEHPRPGVARLWLRGHGTDLDERESQRTQRIRSQGVLIEPGRQPERAGQATAERLHPQHRICWGETATEQPRNAGHRRGTADQPETQTVRGLRG